MIRACWTATCPFSRAVRCVPRKRRSTTSRSARRNPARCTNIVVRAIRNAPLGEHGLPLMGCGDWNDGMNLIGEHGKGESVWLAFFLHDVLKRFAALAQKGGAIRPSPTECPSRRPNGDA